MKFAIKEKELRLMLGAMEKAESEWDSCPVCGSHGTSNHYVGCAFMESLDLVHKFLGSTWGKEDMAAHFRKYGPGGEHYDASRVELNKTLAVEKEKWLSWVERRAKWRNKRMLEL